MGLLETLGLILMLIIAIAFCLLIAATILGAILFVVMCFISFVYIPLREKWRGKRSSFPINSCPFIATFGWLFLLQNIATMSVRQRFIKEILEDEGRRLLGNQSKAMVGVLRSRSGRLD